MKIKTIRIINFRGLSSIETSLNSASSVIVGPNAVGKTSIFEAIRLAKVILMPRILNDADVTLAEMGGVGNNVIRYDAMAGDINKQLEVSVGFKLTIQEMNKIGSNIANIALLHLRNTHGIQPHQTNVQLASFLSSPQGRDSLQRSLRKPRKHWSFGYTL